MRIIDVVRQLLPSDDVANGALLGGPAYQALPACPTWPPDLFAVVGTIIDRSGCYTQPVVERDDLPALNTYLSEIDRIASSWTKPHQVPEAVSELWAELIGRYYDVGLAEINDNAAVCKTLFKLFAVADEVSQCLGWDMKSGTTGPSAFVKIVLANLLDEDVAPSNKLPYRNKSLCRTVRPDHVVVLPKSITADKGCTIRSLSHNLALVSCHTRLDSEWRIVSRENDNETDLRLLLVPFPYEIPPASFQLASARADIDNKTTRAAFFKLTQPWLSTSQGKRITGARLAEELIRPLIEEAKAKAGGEAPHGVILPECALDDAITVELAMALKESEVDFLITGVLEQKEKTNRWANRAYTLFLDSLSGSSQSKHHRWRIEETQAASYGLTFGGDDPANRQWWEDINVSERRLPFYAFRKDTSLVTLICEDLARMEPAMNAIRAVGPNLVVALLMDGPQLSGRWPGRYASVLADEPGCSVLSFTCSATVDLSNGHYKKSNPDADPRRIVARWTQSSGNFSTDIEMEEGGTGVLLCLKSQSRHQTTMDNRSDKSMSREILREQNALAQV